MTENELLDELVRLTSLPSLREDDVTAARYAAKAGISSRHALDILRKLEREGKLASHFARTPDGHKVRVFKRA